MWPGMRPATGWMANLTWTPASLQELGELPDLVLGLGDGHAVAGRDDHLVGVGIMDGGVVADRSAVMLPSMAAPPPASPERLEDDVDERAVHGLGHELGQQGARRRRRPCPR